MIDFLAANWIWILLVVVAMLAMHRGGGCGSHGNHGKHGAGRDDHAGHR